MTSLDILLQQSINGLMLGIMYSLVAVGFTLYFGVLDVINFAHGDFFMLGSFIALALYAVAVVAGFAGNVFLVVAYLFIGSMLLTGVVGVVTERLCIRPVSKSPMLISLLVTLGLGIASREARRLLWTI